MKKEQKIYKIGYAIGMARTPMGYIRKETMIFTLTDDSKKNKKTIDEFAKKHGCNIVEVWYRFDNDWDKVIPYKIYNYLPTLNEETFAKIKG